MGVGFEHGCTDRALQCGARLDLPAEKSAQGTWLTMVEPW